MDWVGGVANVRTCLCWITQKSEILAKRAYICRWQWTYSMVNQPWWILEMGLDACRDYISISMCLPAGLLLRFKISAINLAALEAMPNTLVEYIWLSFPAVKHWVVVKTWKWQDHRTIRLFFRKILSAWWFTD